MVCQNSLAGRCTSLHCRFSTPSKHTHLLLQEGDLQLWALSDGSLLESMPFADPVTCVAVMHDEPFVLLGCASGNVQVVSLLDSSGNLATGAAHVHTLELQPFQGSTCNLSLMIDCLYNLHATDQPHLACSLSLFPLLPAGSMLHV